MQFSEAERGLFVRQICVWNFQKLCGSFLEDYEMKKVFLLTALSIAVLLSAPLASAGMGQALYERWNGSENPDTLLRDTSTPNYTEVLTSTEWGIGDNDGTDDYRAL